MSALDVIAFDADDTLWHTEHLYAEAQARFKQLLAQYHAPEWIEQRLYETEVRNLEHFGYGIKAFALSMIETAVELTEGRVTGHDIQAVINIARNMLAADVQLLEHAAETVKQLAQNYPLILLTKGDLLDQESKITRSGLAAYFRHIEVVSDKTSETYKALLTKHQIPANRFMMIGNSLRSDVWPVLELGGYAVYVPYHVTWAHEVADLPVSDHPGFFQLEHLGQLPALVRQLNGLEPEGLPSETQSSHRAPVEAQSTNSIKQVIIVNNALKLPKGKLAAQVAHASVAAFHEASELARATWIEEGMPKVVLKADDEEELAALHGQARQRRIPATLIADAGRTVIPAGTVTCLGLGPANDEALDEITGELKLL